MNILIFSPETIEESSLCKSELQRLNDENNRLKGECLQLKEELSQKEEGAGLTPVLSHVKKLVGKLGNDTKEGDELKGDGKYVSSHSIFVSGRSWSVHHSTDRFFSQELLEFHNFFEKYLFWSIAICVFFHVFRFKAFTASLF